MVKKKQWYEIVSPSVFGNKVVGETITDDPKKLINRIVPVSGKELTGEIKKSHVIIKLKVNSVNDGTANTVINGYELQRQYVQRLVRKRYSTVEALVDSKTEDGVKLRVRCLMLIPGKVQANKKKEIRKRFCSEFDKIITNSRIDNLIFLIIAGKVQHTLAKKIEQIRPVRLVEIRKIKSRK